MTSRHSGSASTLPTPPLCGPPIWYVSPKTFSYQAMLASRSVTVRATWCRLVRATAGKVVLPLETIATPWVVDCAQQANDQPQSGWKRLKAAGCRVRDRCSELREVEYTRGRSSCTADRSQFAHKRSAQPPTGLGRKGTIHNPVRY